MADGKYYSLPKFRNEKLNRSLPYRCCRQTTSVSRQQRNGWISQQ
jgi:hypothetical protein